MYPLAYVVVLFLTLFVTSWGFTFPAPFLVSSRLGTAGTFSRQRSTSVDSPQQWRLASTLVPQTSKNDTNPTTTVDNERQSSSNEKDGAIIGDITFLIPNNADKITTRFGSKSPVGNPTVADAVRLLANKAFCFANGRIEATIVSMSEASMDQLLQTDVLIVMSMQTAEELDFVTRVFEARRQRDRLLRQRQCHFALDSAQELPIVVGPYDEINPSFQSSQLPWTLDATAKRLSERMKAAFGRWTSDDFCYAVALFWNQFSGSHLDWVKYTTEATWEKGPIQNAKEIISMFTKCGDCIVPCIKDQKCRECIGKLTQIDARDQVASYRTIVSYESELLRDFSKCIMTKNNIFECDAQIPTIPVVQPITTWRGKPLTEDDAKAILVGHLNDPAAPEGGRRMDTSWKVACGANVAYDQFPSQNQIFYPASKGRNMWYDPVFRVETLDGRHVWCHRHYRVRPNTGKPGTFRFSVLDNGVTSDEYWTLMGCADDLSWACFHYAGAAAAVGMQYLGGLVCTPDGTLPTDPEERLVIWNCLRSAGIEPWELCMVNNDPNAPGAIAAGPPPLNVYRSGVLKATQEASS